MTRSNRRYLVFSKHYKFSRQKLCSEGEVPYETDVTGVMRIGHLVVKYFKNTLKSNFNLFTFAIFSFHILLDPTTVVTQQYLPAKHFKINKNIKYAVLFLKYFKFVEICSSGEHRENPKLSELYTALDVCLSVFTFRNYFM